VKRCKKCKWSTNGQQRLRLCDTCRPLVEQERNKQPEYGRGIKRCTSYDLASLINSIEARRLERAKREDKPLPLNIIYQESGVSKSTINQLLHGTRVPDADTIARMCAWLGHPISRYLRNSATQQAMAERPTLEVISELFDRDVAAKRITEEQRKMMEAVFVASYNAVLNSLANDKNSQKKRRPC
jgi:transcriptional regulator with XRE-family HTH domain